jgi:hypothetical protein
MRGILRVNKYLNDCGNASWGHESVIAKPYSQENYDPGYSNQQKPASRTEFLKAKDAIEER